MDDLEEVVEIIEASENVQVIQPDEVAAVVYASVVHKSKEEEPILVEQVIEELNEVEPFEDELESRTETPEVKTYTHEQGDLLNGIVIWMVRKEDIEPIIRVFTYVLFSVTDFYKIIREGSKLQVFMSKIFQNKKY